MKDNRPFEMDLIAASGALKAFAKRLNDEPVFAVDLEADSMYHFKEKICLIQIATPSETCIIDPLQIADLSCLKRVFSNPKIKKVFHGADYDIRCLYRDYGIEINHLFDTQIAAMFLGNREIGLDALLEKRFNVQLKKKYQKKDWSIRPLPDEMLTYAAMDVLYLIPLAERLTTSLKKMNRLYWVEEENELLSRVRPSPNHTKPLFLKFKGAGKLPSRSLAVLESLLSFRMKIARKKDRPLFKVFSNGSLMKIAHAMPTNRKQLEACSVLSSKQLEMYGAGLTAAVRQARKLSKDDLPVYPHRKRPPFNAGISRRIQLLKTWREKAAEQTDLDPSLICNNTLARAIATENPTDRTELERIPGLRRWQAQVFGQKILSVLGRPNHKKRMNRKKPG